MLRRGAEHPAVDAQSHIDDQPDRAPLEQLTHEALFLGRFFLDVGDLHRRTPTRAFIVLLPELSSRSRSPRRAYFGIGTAQAVIAVARLISATMLLWI